MERVRKENELKGSSQGRMSYHLCLVGLSMLLLLSATACSHQPMLADAGDVIRQTATDANTNTNAPLSWSDCTNIQRVAADAARAHAERTGCPVVRVRRADILTRSDGSPWLVVRLTACGDERVYERTPVKSDWSDATARLR